MKKVNEMGRNDATLTAPTTVRVGENAPKRVEQIDLIKKDVVAGKGSIPLLKVDVSESVRRSKDSKSLFIVGERTQLEFNKTPQGKEFFETVLKRAKEIQNPAAERQSVVGGRTVFSNSSNGAHGGSNKKQKLSSKGSLGSKAVSSGVLRRPEYGLDDIFGGPREGEDDIEEYSPDEGYGVNTFGFSKPQPKPLQSFTPSKRPAPSSPSRESRAPTNSTKVHVVSGSTGGNNNLQTLASQSPRSFDRSSIPATHGGNRQSRGSSMVNGQKSRPQNAYAKPAAPPKAPSKGSNYGYKNTQDFFGINRPQFDGGRSEGLRNLGNTCYLNATVQGLLGISGFVQDLQNKCWVTAMLEGSKAASLAPVSSPDSNGQKDINAVSPAVKSAPLYKSLLTLIRAAKGEGHGVLTAEKLKAAIDAHSDRFSGNLQQDAHEFLGQLLNALHEELTLYASRASAELAAQAASSLVSSTPMQPPAARSTSARFPSTAAKMNFPASALDFQSPDFDTDRPAPVDDGITPNRKGFDSDPATGPAIVTPASVASTQGTHPHAPASITMPPVSELLPTTRNFHAEVNVELTCTSPVCGYKRNRIELYRDFSLILEEQSPYSTDPKITLSSLLENFFTPQELTCKCEKCGHETVRELSRLEALPGVLILHVKRFKYQQTTGSYVKLTMPVEVPLELDLRRYCTATTANASRPPLGPACTEQEVQLKDLTNENVLPRNGTSEPSPSTHTSMASPKRNRSPAVVSSPLSSTNVRISTSDSNIDVDTSDAYLTSMDREETAARDTSMREAVFGPASTPPQKKHAQEEVDLHTPSTPTRKILDDNNTVDMTGVDDEDDDYKRALEASLLETQGVPSEIVESDDFDAQLQEALTRSMDDISATTPASTSNTSPSIAACDDFVFKCEDNEGNGILGAKSSTDYETSKADDSVGDAVMYAEETPSTSNNNKSTVTPSPAVPTPARRPPRVGPLNSKYRLRGVLHHLGQNAFAGHYTADVLVPKNKNSTNYNSLLGDRGASSAGSHNVASEWRRYDDSLVRTVSEEQVIGHEAQKNCYIAFYEAVVP